MKDLETLLRAASFAALQHTEHKRKGSKGEPYINHPLEVAELIASVGKIEDVDVLTAALLHDTVEDTETTPDDITDRFGKRVSDIVAEVTDDKSLPKRRRKELQVEHAPHLSREAKLVKLADKISNIRDVLDNPPKDWSRKRRRRYVEWGEQVVAGMRGTNEGLERRFDELVARAHTELNGSGTNKKAA